MGYKDIFRSIIKGFNLIIPKSKHMVVFSSRPDFSESPMSVYRYMRTHESYRGYTLIWITSAKNPHIPDETIKWYPKTSFMGIVSFFRAKYVFSSHGLFAKTLVKNQLHVGLGHGMALKRYKATALINENRDYKREYSVAVATSDVFRKVMAKCYAMEENEVKVLGIPRNDDLLHPYNDLKMLGISQRAKTIFWLPTFRTPANVSLEHNVTQAGADYDLGIPFWDSSNIDELDRFLEQKDVTLIIKIHMLQKYDSSKLPKLTNITFLTAKECSENNIILYKMLGCGDALITDYSSVYVDYLATDKPMAFIIEDMDKFGDNRGFIFDNPLLYMPGEHVTTKEGLMSFISDISANIDRSKLLREKSREALNVFADDKNTERVVEFVFNQDRTAG